MREELRLESKKYRFEKLGGITLISLVITIVVLIILVGVAIYLGLSNNGIINRVNEAKEATNKQTATEKMNLKITTAQMNKYAEKQEMPTLKELSELLKEDNEIQYVTETSKLATTEYDVPSESTTSIYTKLNEYPYEFEINASLQLASINGVKIPNSNSQNVSQPTGLKANYYIKNETKSKSAFETITSMSGITISKDNENNIDEYISYSTEKGYTVLKSGWYFITGINRTAASNGYNNTIISLILNQVKIVMCEMLANQNNAYATDINNFPIYLNEGDNFYFEFYTYTGVINLQLTTYVYPMF